MTGSHRLSRRELLKRTVVLGAAATVPLRVALVARQAAPVTEDASATEDADTAEGTVEAPTAEPVQDEPVPAPEAEEPALAASF